jgi:hypothetical protein
MLAAEKQKCSSENRFMKKKHTENNPTQWARAYVHVSPERPETKTLS